MSKTVVNRISMCFSRNNEEGLQKLINPSVHTRGAPTILTPEEETMIVERLSFAIKRGFAVGKDILVSIMAQIASDSRKTWKNGVPCEDAVRAFRARHRELTFRNSENKDYAKF